MEEFLKSISDKSQYYCERITNFVIGNRSSRIFKLLLIYTLFVIIYYFFKDNTPEQTIVVNNEWTPNDTYAIIQTVLYYNNSKL